MKPTWTSPDESIRLWLGDALSVLPELHPGSSESIITDPPYGVGYDDWDATVPPQNVLDECLRIARAAVVWFGAATVVHDFAGYSPRPGRMLVWSPGFSLSQTGANGMHYRCHPIWCWRLPKSQDVLGKDLLTHNCEGRHWWNHPATKPLALMVDLVEAFGGDSVLDCYMGSGTTGVACARTGRNFTGIESDPGHFEAAVKRIEAELNRYPLLEPQASQGTLEFA